MIGTARKFIWRGGWLLPRFRSVVTLGIGFLVSCYLPGLAQVCTDPASEVVFNQSFGTVQKPASLGGLVIYEYDASNCPNDNKYTLAPSIDGTCFNSTWNAVPTDHTPGDVQGNMLIVNGGHDPGTFYQQPVDNLCRGSSYEVSLYAMNVLRVNTCIDPLIPDLSIRVETLAGQLISSYAIGRIVQEDPPTWRRYATTFVLPDNADAVVIKLVNNQGGYGCGNDMALDDFQIKQCGACVRDDLSVYVPDAFTPNQDGANDDFVMTMSAKPVGFAVKIFNRWGNLIFTSTDPARHWDGTFGGVACPAETYTWVLSYQVDARTKRNHVQTGKVVLIR